MVKPIQIEDFLASMNGVPLLDVRTPAEFEHGHVPGAYNLPLFDNEERIKVGTTYKQIGREEAILLGFDLTGHKWSSFIKQALVIAPDKRVGVHCWRGGMRSGAMAWALDLYGFEVHLIQGGYKRYRNWVRQQFEKEFRLLILGGMTGSGKTLLLKQMQQMGEQIIDLEDLAKHQGSSYGSKGKDIQPSQEQFENDLADRLRKIDINKRIWLEDESLNIGRCAIPHALWQQMRTSGLINIIVPYEERVAFLAAEYGCLPQQFLVESTERIRKRLGPEQTKHAIAAITEHRMEDFIRIVLVYYDKTYRTGLSKRDAQKIATIHIDETDTGSKADQIIHLSKTLQ